MLLVLALCKTSMSQNYLLAHQTITPERAFGEGPCSSTAITNSWAFSSSAWFSSESVASSTRKHLSWENKMPPYKSKTGLILPCLEFFRCIYRHLHIRYLSPQMRLQIQKLQIYVYFQTFWFQVSIAPQSIVPGAKRDTNLNFIKHILHVRAHVKPAAGF